MHWLNPLALLYLPVIAAVLLLRRRRGVRPRRAVSALFLWKALDTGDEQNRLRVRRQWLVLLQAALLLSLAAALARPTVAVSRPRAVFLVDVSASMGAFQGQETRLALAARAVEQTAQTLEAGTRIVLWTAGSATQSVDEFDAAGIGRAVGRLTVSDGPADLAAALATIRAVEAGATPVFVFSDRPAGDVHDPLLRWTTVGATAPNVAITSLAGRPLRQPVGATEWVVALRNFGSADVEAPVEIRQNSSLLVSERVRVPAGSMTTAVFGLAPAAGTISAHLAVDDALASDNIRHAVVPSSVRRHILLISAGNFFLERALSSLPAVSLEVVRPGGSPSRDRYDLLVCDGCGTPPGNAPVLLVPTPTASAPVEQLRVFTPGHPVVRFVAGSGIGVVPIQGMALAPASLVLAEAGETPVIVASDASRQRVLELRIDLRHSPLVLSTAFPILISNAMAWLTRHGENADDVPSGTPLQWRLDDARSATVVGPDGKPVTATATDTTLSVAETWKAGVYEVRAGDRRDPFVVNTATETESDLTVVPTPAAAPPQPPAVVQTTQIVALAMPLLVVALLLLAIECFLSRPLSHRGMAVRVAAGIAVIAAATGARIPWGNTRLDVLFLLDTSASIATDPEQSAAVINRLAASMSNGDEAGVIVFGDEAAVETPLSPGLRVSTVTAKIGKSATNIEAALRLARERLTGRPLGRLVLLSDGHATRGHSLAETVQLATHRIPVDVVPLNVGLDPIGPSVTAVTAPSQVRIGEPFVVTTLVRGRPATQTTVELTRNGVPVATIAGSIARDGVATLEFSELHGAPGMHTYTAALRLGGAPAGLADAGTVVTVVGQPSLLYVSAGSRSLGRVFEAARWNVTLAGPAMLPSGASALNQYDAVVLEDIDAGDVSAGQSAALSEYVHGSGGGLLIVGGTGTLGNFRTSDLEGLLPVDLRPRSGARGPDFALVLAFDKSGSMADVVGGVSKIEIARQSVLDALKVIPATDLFGVIAFDARPVVIAPLAPSTDLPAITRRLRSLDPAGPTAIAPAIDLADTWLRNSGVARRRVLLVTDGQTAPADVERLRRAVRSRQFELSVVAIGNDADRDLLTSLATASGGRAYFPADVSDLPKIVARGAASASSGRTVQESFAARILPHAATRGISPEMPPTLTSYTVSAPKPGADVILASHLGDPVLAGWNVGLGRVALFTSGIGVADAFLAWPGFAQLWAQTTRWVGRRSSVEGATLNLAATPEGLDLQLTFEPTPGPARIVAASATLRGPSGQSIPLPVGTRSPGALGGSAALSEEGTYVASVDVRRADGSDEQMQQGLYWTATAETPAPPDLPALAEIARLTGGRVLTGNEEPFNAPRPGTPTDIGPLLTNLALIALLVEIARVRGLLPRRARRHPPSSGSLRQAVA